MSGLSTGRHRFPTSLQNEIKIYCKLKRDSGFKIMDIAYFLNIHHSTVVYNIKKFDDFIAFDKKFKKDLEKFNLEYFEKKIISYWKKKLAKTNKRTR
ncbi:MAG: hypothetical protein ACRC0E_04465 [Soonwooa sp.]